MVKRSSTGYWDLVVDVMDGHNERSRYFETLVGLRRYLDKYDGPNT